MVLTPGTATGSQAAGDSGTRREGPWVAPADFKLAFARFRKDNMTFCAAALTYYTLLSLFPALLVGIAVLGIFGESSLIPDAAGYLRDAGAPAETVDAVTSALDSAISRRGTALTALILGLGTAMWAASGAFGGAGTALNIVFRVDEGRGFVRKKLTDLVCTLLVLALVLVTIVLVMLGGGLAEDVLGLVGLGETAAAVWQVARWPGAMASAMLVYAVVYYAAPNVEVRRFEWITPGAVTGVLAWIVASAGFFVYVSNFSTYGVTYGAFAAAVILLVWLWITNLALLFGAELNAAIDVRRRPGLSARYDGPSFPEKVPAEA